MMDLLSRRRDRRRERVLARLESDIQLAQMEEEARLVRDATRRLDRERAAFYRAMGEVPRG